MPSLLSRIRYRGTSNQPSAHSVQSHPSLSLETAPNLEVPIDVLPSPFLGLRIRPDLDSLLESYETEDKSPSHQNRDTPIAPQLSAQAGYSPLSPNPNISRNGLARSPELTLPTTPVSVGQPKFDGASPLGGTFGKQQSPLMNLGSTSSGPSHSKVPTRSRSLGDPAHTHLTLNNVQRSGWNLNQASQLPLSGTFERSSSMRSLPDKKRRIDRRRRSKTRSLNSLRTRRSSPSATPTPPSAIHQSRPDSPRTFGHPTPPYSIRTFGHHENHPPPLPPLDHPELILDVRGSTLDRCKPVDRKRSKTFSVDSRRSSRRSSAEWSSIQATEGILTSSNSWQAQVSREILRLSFGEVAAFHGDPGNSRDASHVAATQHPRAETFISPRPSLSLGSPLFLQGQLNTLYAAYLA